MSITGRAVTTVGSAFTSFDLTNFDLSNVDLPKLDRPSLDAAASALREVAYVGVGFTVLGIQRAQTRRRDFERAVRR